MADLIDSVARVRWAERAYRELNRMARDIANRENSPEAPDDADLREVSVTMSNVVHQLRSALDNLAYALKTSKRAQPVFPVCRVEGSPDDEERFMKQTESLAEDHIKALRRIQPWHWPDPALHPLALLNAWWNKDKHERLKVIVAVPDPIPMSAVPTGFIEGEALLLDGTQIHVTFMLPRVIGVVDGILEAFSNGTYSSLEITESDVANWAWRIKMRDPMSRYLAEDRWLVANLRQLDTMDSGTLWSALAVVQRLLVLPGGHPNATTLNALERGLTMELAVRRRRGDFVAERPPTPPLA